MPPHMSREAQRRALCCELVADVARSAGEVCLKVTGTSMLPAVWPGDVVSVRRCHIAELKLGQIVLFRREGELTAHRIMRVSQDRLVTRGDSLSCCDPPVSAAEIVGQVVGISRAGRCISPEQSSWQRAASSILRRSDLCTRLALALSRRLPRSGDMQAAWAISSPQPVRKW